MGCGLGELWSWVLGFWETGVVNILRWPLKSSDEQFPKRQAKYNVLIVNSVILAKG